MAFWLQIPFLFIIFVADKANGLYYDYTSKGTS